MSNWIKQSTAVVISFGPFLDKTDGVTLETGLVSSLDNGTTGIKLSKNGGALTIRHATVTATTYDAFGMYRVTLDTTDTATLGTLRMAFEEAATCLPVWQDFMVLPANVYDSLVVGSDLLDISMTQILGTAVSTPATAGILDVNVKNIDNDAASASGTVTFPNATLASTTNITAAAGVAVSSIGANVITASAIASAAITSAKFAGGAITSTVIAANAIGSSQIAANAITSAKFAGGAITSTVIAANAIGSSQIAANAITSSQIATDAINANALSASAVNKIVDQNWDEDASTHVGATSTGLALLTSSDTVYNRLGTPAGVSVSADIAAVKAETALIKGYVDTEVAAIKAKTDNLPSDPASSTNVTAVYNRLGAPSLASIAADIGAATAGDSLGQILSTLSADVATIDNYVDTEIAGLVITAAAIKAKTDNLPAAPAAVGDIPTAAAIADANWDEARSGHVAAGSFGENVIADVTKIGGSAASISPTAGVLNTRLTDISIGATIMLANIQNANTVSGVTNPVAVNSLANNIVTSAALDASAANEIADALLDRANGIDTGLTPRHALELAAASVLQRLTGAGTGTERVRNFSNTSDLAVVTVDMAGNKSGIVYDFSI